MSEKKDRTPNLVLRHIREEVRKESRSEFARAMEEKARELRPPENVACTERTVARFEDGETLYPTAPYRRILAATCGRLFSELGFPARQRPKTTSELDTATRGLFDGQQIELLRRSLHEVVSENALSDASVDDWEQTALRHGKASRDRPSGLFVADLSADLTELTRTISRCRSSSALRRLTRVAAQMSGLMLLAFVKLNQREEFRRWARTARIAADEVADPITSAWVRGQEAYGYYYSGDFRDAVDVARHAQEIARNTPSVGAALAAALEARTHATLGQDEATHDALHRAESILLRLDDGALVASAFGYSESQFRFHEGSALTRLGDTRLAWKAHDRALELPSTDYTDRAMTRLDRAECLMRDHDLSGALDYARRTLENLDVDQQRGIILVRAGEIVDALPTNHQILPAVGEFRELLTSLTEAKD